MRAYLVLSLAKWSCVLQLFLCVSCLFVAASYQPCRPADPYHRALWPQWLDAIHMHLPKPSTVSLRLTTCSSPHTQATPHVTGATLLLRNLFATATNKQVVTCLVSSADRTVTPARPNANINGGVLNVMAAHECLGGSLNPPPPAVKLDCKSPQQVKVPVCVNQAAGKQCVSCVCCSSCQESRVDVCAFNALHLQGCNSISKAAPDVGNRLLLDGWAGFDNQRHVVALLLVLHACRCMCCGRFLWTYVDLCGPMSCGRFLLCAP
jgi:hypothetical protein